MNHYIMTRLKKKAMQSKCRYKVVAFGFNKIGDLIQTATNLKRFAREGGSIHAEMALMISSKSIKTIIIARVSNKGKFMPIKPCPTCSKISTKLNIKILSVEPEGKIR